MQTHAIESGSTLAFCVSSSLLCIAFVRHFDLCVLRLLPSVVVVVDRKEALCYLLRFIFSIYGRLNGVGWVGGREGGNHSWRCDEVVQLSSVPIIAFAFQWVYLFFLSFLPWGGREKTLIKSGWEKVGKLSKVVLAWPTPTLNEAREGTVRFGCD